MKVRMRRIYDDPQADDGFRVLTDRLWPRGVSKEVAAIDLWFKDAAPSTELRQWFGHDPDQWEEFIELYKQELADQPEGLQGLLEAVRTSEQESVTLLFAAKDELHNHTIVLAEVLGTRLG